MNYDDIIDGLEIIARRRGLMIQQGDVVMVEAAINALRGRSEFCNFCRPRPSPAAADGLPKEGK